MKLFSQNTKVAALKRVPLLESLTRPELLVLARVAEDLDLPAGKVICKEGTSGREFLAIVEGEVEVTRKGKRLATRGPGTFIGEIALVTGGPRTATVTATTPIRCFVLTAQAFRSLVRTNQGVEQKVLHALAERLRAVTDDPTL